jgi:hypothetical protein
MNTNRFLLTCAVAAALLFCSCGVPRRAETQPSFHGRTLAQWLVACQIARTPAQRTTSSNAVAAIGTNAIPTLLTWVADGTAPGPQPRYSSGLRPALAFSAFKILGPDSRLAVPGLVALTKNQNPFTRRNALWCLAEAVQTDRATITQVLKSLSSDPDPAVQHQAKLYLAQPTLALSESPQ